MDRVATIALLMVMLLLLAAPAIGYFFEEWLRKHDDKIRAEDHRVRVAALDALGRCEACEGSGLRPIGPGRKRNVFQSYLDGE